VIHLAKDHRYHKRTKHIEVEYHKIHQWILIDKVIDLIKISTKKCNKYDDEYHPGGVQSISELHQDSPKIKWRTGSWEEPCEVTKERKKQGEWSRGPISTEGLNEHESRWRLLVFGVSHIHWRRIKVQVEVLLQASQIKHGHVHALCMLISQLISVISRSTNTWLQLTRPRNSSWVLGLCYSSQLGIWYSRLILDISQIILGPSRLILGLSRLMSASNSFQIRFCFQFGLDPVFFFLWVGADWIVKVCVDIGSS